MDVEIVVSELARRRAGRHLRLLFDFVGTLAASSPDPGPLYLSKSIRSCRDIETLNRAAFEGKYDVTPVSFHAYAHLLDTYALLPRGASMGGNYGPIVVAKEDGPRDVKRRKIAIHEGR